MARFWIKATNLTTTLTRSDTLTTLRDAGVAIRDYFKAGGTGDIGATDCYVQWNNSGTFEVVIENDSLSGLASNVATLKSNVRTGLLAVQLSGQAFITACSTDDITVLEQGSVAATAGSSWAPSHTSTAAPTVNNDSSDSAGLGKTFGIGSWWVQTTTGRAWILQSATPTEAVWVPSQGRALTQASHGFAVGDWVYYTGSAYAKTVGYFDATSNARGVVVAVPSTSTFVLAGPGEEVTNLSGLTAGALHYLSSGTAGALTTVAPHAYARPVLYAVSTTAGRILDLKPQAPTWTASWVAHRDNRCTNVSGFSEPANSGTHGLSNDSLGVQRQQITATTSKTAIITYGTPPSPTQAFDIVVDWIPTGTGYNGMVAWDTGTGKRLLLGHDGGTAPGSWYDVGLGASLSPYAGRLEQNRRGVLWIRGEGGTNGMVHVWWRGRYAGAMRYSDLLAAYSSGVHVGKYTDTGANNVYIYAVHVLSGAWAPVDPAAPEVALAGAP